MRYWLLTTEYPPFFGGGIATYCYHTTNMLKAYGHEVTVFVPDEKADDTIKIVEQEGIRIVKFKPGGESYYHYLGYVAALSYQFSEIIETFVKREGPPHIIEAQDYLGIAYFLLQKKYTMCGAVTDTPLLLTLHTPKFLCDIYDQVPGYTLPNFWIGEMERFCIKAADAIVSPSYFLLNELSKHIDLSGVLAKVIRNPYGADWSALPSETQREKNEILFVGRLEPRKGVTLLLEYFRDLWDEGFAVRLNLVGNDWYSPTRRQMMSDYLMKKYKPFFERGLVTWHGPMPPAELRRWLSRASLGVLPSTFENFPYVAVEMMVHGMVTLGSDSGGHAEIIEDGKSGFIFSHKDKTSFKKQFIKALALSDEERTAMGLRARERVRDLCSYERVYAQKFELIGELLSSQKARSSVFPFLRNPSTKPKGTDMPTSTGEETDLLSVVIPYYNMGPFLRETVQSVFDSTYPNKEVIIVDDGTNDPYSVAVLHQIGKEYPVRIIHKQNEGLARARNDGALAARGEFLAFLDADDLVHPEYYRLAINILKSYKNVSFVGAWTEYFGASQGVWPTFNPEPPFLLVHNTISSGLVLRRKDFIRYGLNDPDMVFGLEDYESVVRMVRNGCMGVVIPKPLYRYRVRHDSMFRQITRDAMIFLYDQLVQKNSELYKEYAVDVVRLLNSNGPGYLYDNPTWGLPPLGFLQADEKVQTADWSQCEMPPVELKQALLALWSNPWFRRLVSGFFRLKMDRLFRHKAR